MGKNMMTSMKGYCFGAVVFAICFISDVYMQQQTTKFSCEGRASGYYADVDSGCQIYHMCDTLGRKFSYSCPNTTLFQQRMLICDHWYMVNCSKSETDYDVNLLIGQREKPFVEDNAYYRTPRPDLLAHPSVSEYNIIYRTGRAQEKNLVGANDQPYFLPSHWSTQNGPTSTPKPKTPKTKKPYFTPPKENSPSYSQSYNPSHNPSYNPSYNPSHNPSYNPSYNPSHNPSHNPSYNPSYSPSYSASYSPSNVQVNFKSSFKATTPVYPKIAPTEIPVLDTDYSRNQPKSILQPPKGSVSVHDRQDNIKVNFESHFKATTPVYPTLVTPEKPYAEEEIVQGPSNVAYGLSSILEPPKNKDQSDLKTSQTTHGYRNSISNRINEQTAPEEREEVVQQNFRSTFKATTPVYPTFVSSEVPLAIEDTFVDPNRPGISSVIQPPKNYDVNSLNTLLQPPLYKSSNAQKKLGDEIKWTELRRTFLIPDYVFPLDMSDNKRNYDQGPDSFQILPNAYAIA